MQLENGKIIAIKAALKPDGGPVAGKPTTPVLGRPPNPQMAAKMPMKQPPIDRNLAALSSRRGTNICRISFSFNLDVFHKIHLVSNAFLNFFLQRKIV